MPTLFISRKGALQAAISEALKCGVSPSEILSGVKSFHYRHNNVSGYTAVYPTGNGVKPVVLEG